MLTGQCWLSRFICLSHCGFYLRHPREVLISKVQESYQCEYWYGQFQVIMLRQKRAFKRLFSVRKFVLNKQYIAFYVSETYIVLLLPLNYNCLWRGRKYSNLSSMRTLPRSQDLSPGYVLCYCGIIWKRENQKIESITNLPHPISLALYGYGVS